MTMISMFHGVFSATWCREQVLDRHAHDIDILLFLASFSCSRLKSPNLAIRTKSGLIKSPKHCQRFYVKGRPILSVDQNPK